jgi:hypothetical protein
MYFGGDDDNILRVMTPTVTAAKRIEIDLKDRPQ